MKNVETPSTILAAAVLLWAASACAVDASDGEPEILADLRVPTDDGLAEYRFQFSKLADGPLATRVESPLGYPEVVMEGESRPFSRSSPTASGYAWPGPNGTRTAASSPSPMAPGRSAPRPITTTIVLSAGVINDTWRGWDFRLQANGSKLLAATAWVELQGLSASTCPILF